MREMNYQDTQQFERATMLKLPTETFIGFMRCYRAFILIKMDNQLIDKKIQELRKLLEKELPNTAVWFELELTGTSSHYRVSHKYPEQLKRELITMRNIKGDFIR